MLYVIGYFLISVVILGILFRLIEHAPSGWEDENGFHISTEPAHQLNKAVKRHARNTDVIFGNTVARYHAHN